MSGGVDSSVAAALLTEQGYRCIGVMMRLWAEVASGVGSGNKCCDEESVDDARRVANQLGMPFYLINVEQPFKKSVVDLFIDGYSAGLTPNPCLACNRHIRFDYLLNYARRLGADYLATGHYARLRRQADGSVHLLRGVDTHKDQSYVLSMLGPGELNDLLFPVGDYAKDEVRRMAAARNLPIHSKHDSMDLCFVVDDDYRRFLKEWAPDAMTPGEIVDVSGNVLGMHSGLPNYHGRPAPGAGSQWDSRASVRRGPGAQPQSVGRRAGRGAGQGGVAGERRQLDARRGDCRRQPSPVPDPLHGPPVRLHSLSITRRQRACRVRYAGWGDQSWPRGCLL